MGKPDALRTAIDAFEASEVEETQLPLEGLGLPVTDAVVRIRERTGKPGRPLGARNRRTEEMANYLLSKYAHPLERLAQIWSTGTEELAVSLGCSKQEALVEQRLAITAALPYLQPKLPLAVDLTNRKEIRLTILEDASHAPGAGQDDDDVLTLTATVIKDAIDG
jgi:hypothetical protein